MESHGIKMNESHGIKMNESDEPSDQSNYELFIETNNIQNSAHIDHTKNENSD